MTFCKFKEAVSMKLKFLHAAVFDKGKHVSVYQNGWVGAWIKKVNF